MASADDVSNPAVSRALVTRATKTSKVKRPVSQHKRRQLEQRARWIVREWDRSPSYSYAEMIDAVRERFECGYSAAENAYARASEMFNETLANIDQGKLISMYWKLYEHALTDPRPARAAVAGAKILDSIFDRTGMAAPQEHVIAFQDVQKMAHLGVIGMTPTQRAQRERELLARAQQAQARAPIDVESVEVVERVLPTVASTIEQIVDEEFSSPIGGHEEDNDDDEP